jgi:hypothetical protein
VHALALTLVLAVQAAPAPQTLSGRGGVAAPARLVPAGAVLFELGAGVDHARDAERTTLRVTAPEARLRAGLFEGLELRADARADITYADEGGRALPEQVGLDGVRAGVGLGIYEDEGVRWAAHAGALLPARALDPWGAFGELGGRIALGAAEVRASLGARWATRGIADSVVEVPIVLGVEAPALGETRVVGEVVADTTVFPVRRAEISLLVGGTARVAPSISVFAHGGVNIVGGPPSYFALVGVSLLFLPIDA